MTTKKEDKQYKKCKCKRSNKTKQQYQKNTPYAFHVHTYNEHITKLKKEQRRQKIKEYRDYKAYEKKRREESKTKRLRIKKLEKIILATWPKMPESDVAKFLCILDMVFRDKSLRLHVEYMHKHRFCKHLWPKKDSLKIWPT